MNRIEALKIICDQARQGELIFPTGLDVSLKILRVLDDPDCHIDLAAKLILGEPLLSARIVAVANSVAYNRSGQKITDLRNAVSRIGLRTARALTAAIATRQMAGTPTFPALRAATARLWEHTAHVAALAHVIARRVTHQDAETALFAGIVHEIGGFYLISRAKDFPGLLEGEPADWAEHAEAEIGRAILHRLAIPEPVISAIESMWEGYLALPPVSLGDTLLLANDLSPVASPLYETHESKNPSEAPVIDSIIDQKTLSNILDESAAEVESLTAALRF
ncbi:MAG: histidine kinase [Betaproteobacteria bacterium HGW-Betaproteobacteria-10]|jgi:HD-like signal output (HDOD) protein|nr:MAG: histidine kinase [Betaproteobacteria bacterium HGW-Betaproteobacteria-10]